VSCEQQRDGSYGSPSTVREEAGFEVAVCTDHVGRIISRLVVPKYNAALRFLDEGLATRADMDLTCRLGLGIRMAPLSASLAGPRQSLRHHESTLETYGTPAYAPPRRAIVAGQRRGRSIR